MNFVSIDFETANFKRSSVCSVGLAVVENGKIVETIHKLIKPNPNYFESINKRIHGITEDDVKKAPTFKELYPELLPYLENKEIVAHNASFDISALRNVIESYNLNFPNLNYYCSMILSKKLLNDVPNYQLPTILSYLDINFHNHHNAEADAIGSAMIILKLIEKAGVRYLGELVEATDTYNGELRSYNNSYRPFYGSTSIRDTSTYKKKDLYEIDESKFDYESPFFDKKIVFTGGLQNFTREDVTQLILNIGGNVIGTVSKKTDYLILGNVEFGKYNDGKKSTKLKKAEDLIEEGYKLEIISENDFYNMVHLETTLTEITVDLIEIHSKEFSSSDRLNFLSGKTIFFDNDLSEDTLKNKYCVGLLAGRTYNKEYFKVKNTESLEETQRNSLNEVNKKSSVMESDVLIISDSSFENLKRGIKKEIIVTFEQIKNNSNPEENKKCLFITESAFNQYIDYRMNVRV